MSMRVHWIITVVAAVLCLPAAAMAEGRIYAESGVALNGTDPVAYFELGEPVEGSADHIHEWRGVEWRFASTRHRDLFAADPAAYAPRYGGWCAWAAARGYAAPTVPEAWTIVDGSLYLNASLGVQRRWERDIAGFIATADEKWPDIF